MQAHPVDDAYRRAEAASNLSRAVVSSDAMRDADRVVGELQNKVEAGDAKAQQRGQAARQQSEAAHQCEPHCFRTTGFKPDQVKIECLAGFKRGESQLLWIKKPGCYSSSPYPGGCSPLDQAARGVCGLSQ